MAKLKPEPDPPARGSDRELMGLVCQIAELLADRDPVVVSRVLVKSSSNGVGYMP